MSTKILAGLFLIIATYCLWQPMAQISRISERVDAEYIASLPRLTPTELEQRVALLKDAVHQVAGDNPDTYYVALDEKMLLEKLAFSRGLDGADAATRRRVEGGLAGIGQEFGIFLERYGSKFGREKMRDAGVVYRTAKDASGKMAAINERVSAAMDSPSMTFFTYYPISMLAILCFFLARIRNKELHALVECWRLLPAIALWPIAVWFYPHRISPARQMKEALAFAAYALSAMVSFGAMGGIAKAGEKGQKKNVDESAWILSKELHGGLKYLPLSNDATKAPNYYSPEYSWKLSTKIGMLFGSGFVDVGDIPTFTNNAVNLGVPKSWKFPIYASTEVGWSEKTGEFVQMGPRWLIHETPGISKVVGKVFNALALSWYERIEGVRVPHEALLGWSTKPVRIGPFSFFSDGFVRFRESPAKDVGKPALWIFHERWPHFRIGTEIEIVGHDFTPMFGLKLAY